MPPCAFIAIKDAADAHFGVQHASNLDHESDMDGLPAHSQHNHIAENFFAMLDRNPMSPFFGDKRC